MAAISCSYPLLTGVDVSSLDRKQQDVLRACHGPHRFSVLLPRRLGPGFFKVTGLEELVGTSV